MQRCAASPVSIFQSAQAAGLDNPNDELVLRRASEQGRILVNHDKRTMPLRLAQFAARGGESPGVLLVIPQHAPVWIAAETLILILGGQPARRMGESSDKDPVLMRKERTKANRRVQKR